MKVKAKKYFNIVKASDERGEIHIYDDIVPTGWEWGEETSASTFRDDLKALDGVSVIDLRINSGGGDVFEASAIYNMLKRHKARVEVHIDGLAASAASVVAMAGDKITMPKNAMMMIHNAWTIGFGNHHDLRKQADDLEKINESSVKQAYLSKNPELDIEELTNMMDQETWLAADEALELGLVDEVVQATQVAASLTDEQKARYKNAPSSLVEKKEGIPSTEDKLKEMLAEMKVEIIAELKSDKKQKEKPAHNGWLF